MFSYPFNPLLVPIWNTTSEEKLKRSWKFSHRITCVNQYRSLSNDFPSQSDLWQLPGPVGMVSPDHQGAASYYGMPPIDFLPPDCCLAWRRLFQGPRWSSTSCVGDVSVVVIKRSPTVRLSGDVIIDANVAQLQHGSEWTRVDLLCCCSCTCRVCGCDLLSRLQHRINGALSWNSS